MAMAAMLEGRHEDLTVKTDRPTPIVRDAQTLLRRGIEALERDHFEEANVLFKQAAELSPQSPDVFLALGIAQTRLLLIPEAVTALETAIGLAPANFYPHFRLGELYMRVGVPTKAKEELDRAMELSENTEQRRMVREMMAIDARRAAKRAWRPDFGRLVRKRRTTQ